MLRKEGVSYNKRSFDIVGVVTSGLTQTWLCRVVTRLGKGGVTYKEGFRIWTSVTSGVALASKYEMVIRAKKGE